MSKNKYMISVIIPCYNAADTIVRTLESVEEQTFKDYEVVLMPHVFLSMLQRFLTQLKAGQSVSKISILERFFMI